MTVCEHEYENANCTNCANGEPFLGYECAKTRGVLKEYVHDKAEENRKKIRAEVIDEITQKVEFEEKWLFDCYKENGCKYSSKDIDIAFNGIKHHLRKLKEQK